MHFSGRRYWGVAFLTFAAGSAVTEALFSPICVLTALGLIGTAASVLGNEAAIRWGWCRLIAVALPASIVVDGSIGFIGTLSYSAAVILLLIYGFSVAGFVAADAETLCRCAALAEQRGRG